jgi:hypothetical protein
VALAGATVGTAVVADVLLLAAPLWSGPRRSD